MNWAQARIELVSGKRVKRPNWETFLVWSAGQIRWDISDALARKCNDDGSADRIYQPTAIEVEADDWVAE